ncbi:MAG: hypothetical protein LBP31_03065 [Holosporales bacterium]|jgi:hypothetical protein|nr:hypothetical protein [Holosporales bacterium]
MKFLKKLIAYTAIVVCLFLLSYTPFNLGEIFFKFQKLEVSAKVNFLLIAIIIFIFLISCINSIIQSTKKNWKSKNDEKVQEKLIELLFQRHVPLSFDMSSKYKVLEKAIICHTYEIHNINPPCFLETSLQNKLLFAHENKVNIKKCLTEGNILKARAFVTELLLKTPQYCNVIQDEILKLAPLEQFNFDPRQYKYNLSPKYVERYMETVVERDNSNVSLLIKTNKNYPGNVKIALALVKYLDDDKKIIDVIKRGFEITQDRRLAAGLLFVKNRENLLETAETITSNYDKSVESLWFMSIINTELGHISKASDLLKDIIESKDSDINEVAKFFIVNHSKFAHDVEIWESIRRVYTAS